MAKFCNIIPWVAIYPFWNDVEKIAEVVVCYNLVLYYTNIPKLAYTPLNIPSSKSAFWKNLDLKALPLS